MEEYAHLIKSSAKGNRIAQGQLFSLLGKKLFPVCLWYSQTREEAEDIMQESFLKVYKYIKQYKFSGSFEGWVKKIIIRTAIDYTKSRHHLYALVTIDDTIEQAEDAYATEKIFEDIDIKKLIEMTQNLPPMYRMVFNLYVFEDMKHGEIASLLGISEGTSKSNLHDARKILQAKLSTLNKISKTV